MSNIIKNWLWFGFNCCSSSSRNSISNINDDTDTSVAENIQMYLPVRAYAEWPWRQLNKNILLY